MNERRRSILKNEKISLWVQLKRGDLLLSWVRTNAIFKLLEMIFSVTAFVFIVIEPMPFSCIQDVVICSNVGYMFLMSILLYFGHLIDQPSSVCLEMVYHILAIIVSFLSLWVMLNLKHNDLLTTPIQKALLFLLFIIAILHILNIIGICGCKDENSLFRCIEKRKRRASDIKHPISGNRRVTFYAEDSGERPSAEAESSTIIFQLPDDKPRLPRKIRSTKSLSYHPQPIRKSTTSGSSANSGTGANTGNTKRTTTNNSQDKPSQS